MFTSQCIKGEHSPWGTFQGLNKMVLQRDYCRIWACVCDLGPGLRKWGFTLHWMMSGSRAISRTDHFNKSFLEGEKNRVRQ